MSRLLTTSVLALSLAGAALAQGGLAAKENPDAGGGKGMVTVALSLSIDEKAKLTTMIADPTITIPSQVSVQLTDAATICGVDVNKIASSNDKGAKSCTATTATQALADAVKNQT